MGMYTEFVFASRLKKETPSDVIAILDYMTKGETQELKKRIQLPGDDFFKCDRWCCLFTMDSYYFDGKSNSILNYDKIADSYFLTVRSNLKNYDNEIEKFLKWINPYLDKYGHEFLGYWRYEECEDPELIYYDEINGGK